MSEATNPTANDTEQPNPAAADPASPDDVNISFEEAEIIFDDRQHSGEDAATDPLVKTPRKHKTGLNSIANAYTGQSTPLSTKTEYRKR